MFERTKRTKTGDKTHNERKRKHGHEQTQKHGQRYGHGNTYRNRRCECIKIDNKHGHKIRERG